MNVRHVLAIAAFATAFGSPSVLRSQAAAAVMCKDGTTATTTGRGACSHHGGVDKNASQPAMATGANASVTCKDGTTSTATGRGACSRHGGVATAAAAGEVSAPAPTPAAPPAPTPAAKPAPAPAPAAAAPAAPAGTARTTAHEDNNPTGAIAKCKDGLYSHSAHRQGACSRHGGVAQWTTQ